MYESFQNMSEKFALTLDEFRKAGGPCLSKSYQEIKDGKLRVVKLGKRTLVLRDEAERYFRELPSGEKLSKPPGLAKVRGS